MKKLLLLLILFSGSLLQAQNVNISDTNFKNALLNHIPVIDTNGDGEIQVSEAAAFTGTIDISNKNIWYLTGIEAFTNITGLNCNNNHLISIDISNNTALTELDCRANLLTDLDVSANTSLTHLDCSRNDLSSLDISVNTNLTYLKCSINALTSLNVSNNINIDTLDIHLNLLNHIDISNNTNLESLICYENQLTGINLSNNTNLKSLDCSHNPLNNLDVSNNTSLELLSCVGSHLNNINLTQNVNLTELHCEHNNLSSLDVSNLTNLSVLSCFNNQLSNLNLLGDTNLTDLHCENNNLSTLDISQNTNLSILWCLNNQLTDLDASQNVNLSELQCGDNQLNSLNLSNLTNLTEIGCYNNQISNIDVSSSTNLTKLYCQNNQLTDLDISQNTNLSILWCLNNQLTDLFVSNNTYLEHLNCKNNLLTNLDIANNQYLMNLNCAHNQISTLDASNTNRLYDLDCEHNQISSLTLNNNINRLYCGYNQLTDLDVSNCTSNLIKLRCNDNPDLSYINLKNGNNDDIVFGGYYPTNFENLPNLQIVCVDELNTNLTTHIETQVGHAVTFTKYCSLVPAQYNTIDGSLLFDLDYNGCDVNDPPMANILVTTDNGTESFGTFTQSNGQYFLYTNQGNFTTTIDDTILSSYSTINPNTQTNTFSGINNSFTADFCVVPNQIINDINISLFCISHLIPGYNLSYRIVYKNVGSTPLNGEINLTFDNTKLNFVSAGQTPSAQTSNSLTFDYSNLNPFETKVIDLEFYLLPPPTVNIGDNLQFTTTINPVAGDVTPNDNTYTLNQTVVGSHDPNDITCLEGDEILVTDTDNYLHYVIRFQNTGTAEAQNIVVTNELDDNLDWSTLQLESISHNNRVAITNGKDVEFIFENINLPDSTTDEPNSHGYIAYKIKPKANIALGDVISNNADIYFDYNPAVATNTVTTTVVNSLGVDKNTLLDFSVYPTPTTNILNVSSKTKIEQISIYNQLSQRIIETQKTQIDVSNLSKGVYLVKVKDLNGNFGMTKIVKK